MADDSNRIGTSRLSAALGQVRNVTGVAPAASGGAGSVSIDAGNAGAASSSASSNWFGPRGNRMLPADYPTDQLDRRAARGTYLDILV